jgi:hypothetical protein
MARAPETLLEAASLEAQLERLQKGVAAQTQRYDRQMQRARRMPSGRAKGMAFNEAAQINATRIRMQKEIDAATKRLTEIYTSREVNELQEQLEFRAASELVQRFRARKA